MAKEFYSHGKLLLTGEYAVLDGALALALPTKRGQKMTIKNTRGSDLIWKSIDHNGNNWFSADMAILDFSPHKTTDPEKSKLLKKLFKGAINLNSEFLSKWNGFKVQTELEFDRNWGLGSSSTLLDLIAQWADVNPLELYFKVFDGSGYDVACAAADGPITYFSNDEEIGYTPVEWTPSFSDKLFFVHLNEKADSQIAVRDYLKKGKGRKGLVKEITKITEEILEVKSLSKFQELIEKHEDLVGASLAQESVKSSRFTDFSGSVKSLGAWGGDFVLACSDNAAKTQTYFQEKGYSTVIPYADMVL